MVVGGEASGLAAGSSVVVLQSAPRWLPAGSEPPLPHELVDLAGSGSAPPTVASRLPASDEGRRAARAWSGSFAQDGWTVVAPAGRSGGEQVTGAAVGVACPGLPDLAARAVAATATSALEHPEAGSAWVLPLDDGAVVLACGTDP